MTTSEEQQRLIGAMGLASWRVHHRLIEHVSVAPMGSVVSVNAKALTTSALDNTWANEVGLTDGVMAALWKYGPRGVALAVTPNAEHWFLGADIAIVERAAQRIHLYQAKLGVRNGTGLQLKSRVDPGHLVHLRARSVALRTVTYQVSGKLALYQVDFRQDLCTQHASLKFQNWWTWAHPQLFRSDRTVALRYYRERLLSHLCSPSGILTAPPSTDSVRLADTEPWEYQFFERIYATSPRKIGLPSPFDPWAPVEPDVDRETAEGDADQEPRPSIPPSDHEEFVQELRSVLDLPEEYGLYALIV